MSEEDREIIEAFAEESLELLRSCESALNGLLTADEDEQNDLWNALLRALHTVKGSAGFLGDGEVPKRIESCTHATEDRAKALHGQSGPLDGDDIDALANEVEVIRALLDHLLDPSQPLPEAGPPVPAPSTGSLMMLNPVETVPDSPPERAAPASSPPTAAAPPPAAAAPPPAAPPPAAAPPAPPKKAAAPKKASSRSNKEEMLRIRPERIDHLQSNFGEVLVSQLQSQALTSEMVEFRESTAEMVAGWRGISGQLDELLRGLSSQRRQELRAVLRAFGQSLKDTYKTSYQLARRAHSIDGEARSALVNLEDGIRALKLMPLEPFLQGFASTVRASAREVGKKARLEVDARGAEIDRAVLMRLRDPLVHLVRNSVGHGIETPAERAAAGKDPRGVVRLEARLEAQRVFLHIGDDGRGLDVERVREKAVAKGLIDPHQTLDDQAALEVILMPGFSTREQADKISGRGIGMDVVADTIRSIGGSISIENTPGQGATFILEVPITTSTSQGMVVRVGERRFGLPYINVHRVMRVAQERRKTLENRDVVEVHGDPLAIVGLAEVLGVEGCPVAAKARRRPAVVLRNGSRRMVLEVDEIVGAVEMLIKPLCRSFSDHPLILGAAVGADSEILPVIDVPNVFAKATQGALRRSSRASTGELPAEAGARPAAAPTTRRVLLVDDSVTMRTLERDILVAAGFEVEIAEDGQRGLEVLRSSQPFDLVVTDLQMPNLDGIGFTTHLRSEAWPTTPVVMVTTVDDETTRKRAMEAGVDRYLVKREFTRATFIGVVEDMLGTGGAA